MPRRRKILLTIAAALVVAVGGLVVAFVVSSPQPAELSIDVATKAIPLSWAEPQTEPVIDTEGEPDALEDETPSEPFVSTGSLALIGDGKPFGEEVYELTISEDRATLHSSGRFWFKVVVATVNVTFEQTFEGEGDLRPVMYVAEFHAPLGFDRSIRATVEDDRVTVERRNDEQQITIAPERTFTLGTFSTYVLLPRLFALRREDGSASFEVLVFGGPPDQELSDDADGLPVMTVERMGTASLIAGETVLEADCYTVSSDLGESELFARGDEFLAFRAGEEDESLLVYRSDFFPDGIEIASVTSLR